MELKILDAQVCKQGQHAYFTQILDARLPYRTVGKLKIEIRTDTRPSQAYARISKYGKSKWHPLAELLELGTNPDLAYRKEPPAFADFNIDQARLLELAIKILE